MTPQIKLIDMFIRDERILNWIHKRASGGEVRIPHSEIAKEFGCHRNTARAIIWRLIGSGHLSVRKTGAGRGGFVYRVERLA